MYKTGFLPMEFIKPHEMTPPLDKVNEYLIILDLAKAPDLARYRTLEVNLFAYLGLLDIFGARNDAHVCNIISKSLRPKLFNLLFNRGVVSILFAEDKNSIIDIYTEPASASVNAPASASDP